MSFINEIIIVTNPAPCTEGEMRLYSGISSRYGNVRVCINGIWSKICGYGNSVLDDNLASVICSELGYSQYGKLIMYVSIKACNAILLGAITSKNVWYDSTYPYNITNVQCYGNETKFKNCYYKISSSSHCSYNGAVAVFCQKSEFT